MGAILFACADESIAKNVYEAIDSNDRQIEVIITSRDKFAEDLNKVDREISVVVSRGGLAQYIKNNFHYHVVFISISMIDILSKVRELKERGAKKIAILGTQSWLDNDTIRANEEDLPGCVVFANETREEQLELMDKLPSMGFDAAMTGLSDQNKIESMGLMHAPLVSNTNSIRRAYDEAKFIASVVRAEELRSRQVRMLLDASDDAMVIINADEVSYANSKAQSLFNKQINTPDVFTKYVKMHNVTTMVNEIPVLVNSTSYALSNDEFGTMLSFKPVKAIHKSEQIVRRSQLQACIAKNNFGNIISESVTMQRCKETARRLAESDSNILICGETGTGKELFAESIHNASKRKEQPFVTVNCSGVSPQMLEVALFGRAEYTGSSGHHQEQPGYIELAHGGTLFIDEIESLPQDLQGRLARVLENKGVFRLKDEKITPVDIRLICSANVDLQDNIEKGKFRADLYYRISTLNITVPPLRNRTADIVPLFNYYLHLYNNEYKQNVKLSGKEAIRILESYSWPGNVRELINLSERCVLLCETNVISDSFLSDLLVNESSYTASSTEPQKAVKRRRKPSKSELERLLKIYSKQDVCNMLGISRTTLWRMIQNYEIHD